VLALSSLTASTVTEEGAVESAFASMLMSGPDTDAEAMLDAVTEGTAPVHTTVATSET
jgi:hypothetical protein